jgi:hypothetical protein
LTSDGKRERWELIGHFVGWEICHMKGPPSADPNVRTRRKVAVVRANHSTFERRWEDLGVGCDLNSHLDCVGFCEEGSRFAAAA